MAEKQRRASKRYAARGKVSIAWPGSAIKFPGSLLDLSAGGCLIKLESSCDFELDSAIEVSCRSSYLAFRTLGSIRQRRNDGLILGIAFVHPSQKVQTEINDLLLELKSNPVARPREGTYQPMDDSLTLWQKWFENPKP